MNSIFYLGTTDYDLFGAFKTKPGVHGKDNIRRVSYISFSGACLGTTKTDSNWMVLVGFLPKEKLCNIGTYLSERQGLNTTCTTDLCFHVLSFRVTLHVPLHFIIP